MVPFSASLDPPAHQALARAHFAHASFKAVTSVLTGIQKQGSSPEEKGTSEQETASALKALEIVLEAIPFLAFSEDEAVAGQLVLLVERVLQEQVPAECGRNDRQTSGTEPEKAEEWRSESGGQDDEEKGGGSKSESKEIRGKDGREDPESNSLDASPKGGSGEEVLRRARGVVLQLITHKSGKIRRAGYEALLEASAAGGLGEQRVGGGDEAGESVFNDAVVGSDEVVVEVLSRGMHQKSTAQVRAGPGSQTAGVSRKRKQTFRPFCWRKGTCFPTSRPEEAHDHSQRMH
jgi:hypothetical protein